MAYADPEGLRQRKPVFETLEKSRLGYTTSSTSGESPDGIRPTPVRPGTPLEVLRIVLFAVYFLVSCLFIHGTQLIGIPLYWIDRDYYYTWMAMTKQHFGLLITTMTQYWSPTVVRVSGDASMEGQLKQTPDGRLECAFPERLVLISNHQIYTDWLYFWWISYTAGFHGHIYIILKQSLKWVPLIGPAMQLYSFIFMARKWASDQSRIGYRLQKLKLQSKDDKGKSYLNPMWLLIFPEGTNLSANTRRASAKWSAKSGTPDMKHTVLPRSTGLHFCLSELKGTVEYVYDCTIAYEGVPTGQYGQDIFTLRSVYFQGRAPKSVNMYWRRYKMSDIPVDDADAMQKWVLQRWREKDELLEKFHTTGRFPADVKAVTVEQNIGGKDAAGEATSTTTTVSLDAVKSPYIETEVRPKTRVQSLEMYVPVVAAALVCKNLIRMVNFATGNKFSTN